MKLTKIKFLVFFTTIITGIIYINSIFRGTVSDYYETYNLAKEDRLIERGWLPLFLPYEFRDENSVWLIVINLKKGHVLYDLWPSKI